MLCYLEGLHCHTYALFQANPRFHHRTPKEKKTKQKSTIMAVHLKKIQKRLEVRAAVGKQLDKVS